MPIPGESFKISKIIFLLIFLMLLSVNNIGLNTLQFEFTNETAFIMDIDPSSGIISDLITINGQNFGENTGI